LYCCFVGGFIDTSVPTSVFALEDNSSTLPPYKNDLCMRGLLMRDFVIHGIPVKTAEENAPLMWSMFRAAGNKAFAVTVLDKGKTDGAFR